MRSSCAAPRATTRWRLEDELAAFGRRLDATDAVVATKVDGVDEASFPSDVHSTQERCRLFIERMNAKRKALEERAKRRRTNGRISTSSWRPRP